MKQSDKELLEKYLAYRRKRNIIIIIFIIVVIALSVGGFIFWQKMSNKDSNINKQDTNAMIEEKEMEDKEKPIIILSQKEISIFQNDIINYEAYVSSAIDNVDGDLTSNVSYNTIDTSKVGEFQIIYSVQDKAKNTANEILKVVIKEKPKSEETSNTSKPSNNVSANKPSGSGSSGSGNSSSNKTSTGGSSSTNKNNSNDVKKTKDFLFEDGYNMNNVSQVASDYIDANGGRGEAYPIRDAEGVIIGMRVKIY